MSDDNFNFEESLQQLEVLVKQMEQGNLSLKESLQAFEQGIALTRQCQQALDQAEQKVQILMQDSNGQLHEKPLFQGIEEVNEPQGTEPQVNKQQDTEPQDADVG